MQRGGNGCQPTPLETIKVIHIFRTDTKCFDRSDSSAFLLEKMWLSIRILSVHNFKRHF